MKTYSVAIAIEFNIYLIS